MIRDKTDFNQKLPQHKKLQKFLGVELILQKFGVDLGLGASVEDIEDNIETILDMSSSAGILERTPHR